MYHCVSVLIKYCTITGIVSCWYSVQFYFYFLHLFLFTRTFASSQNIDHHDVSMLSIDVALHESVKVATTLARL